MVNHKPVIQMQAFIKQVGEDIQVHEVRYHQLHIHEIVVINAEGIKVSEISKEMDVVIRYGDSDGIAAPIEGLEAGKSLELKGVYLEQNGDAYPSLAAAGPVLHYTHQPIGYIVYNGQRYE
ncbi:hypothetical protein [Paenibacillus sp. 481]|uniref:hypothetical protein n=1 Tax=Paenibacillus sp. 481 TaxID=2835869 RepID=UPI001E33BFD9|nr:hypothetical protein [Paenibacillus sp. 481]UHA73786.1 hypothetical protein KIK04_01030 [Paenibacillus sp. 481]